MEFERNYQVPGQIQSGMFCSKCGRPTILSSGLCPSCCSDKYETGKGDTLPKLPTIDHEYTSENKYNQQKN